MSPLTCTDCGVGEWVAAVTADPPKCTWRTRNRQVAGYKQSLGISESESSAPPHRDSQQHAPARRFSASDFTA